MAVRAVDVLEQAVASLAAEPVEGEAHHRELVELYALRSRLEAQIARRVEVFDARGDSAAGGQRSTVAWLAAQCRLDPVDAAREVRAARALRSLPAVRELWESGATTSGHVQRVVRARHVIKADQHFDELEGRWAGLCASGSTVELMTRLTEFKNLLDDAAPGTPDLDNAAPDTAVPVVQADRRDLSSLVSLDFGVISGQWDKLDFEVVWRAIEHERETHRVENDERTVGQQRADALVAIANAYLAGIRPTSNTLANVSVIVDEPTLAGYAAGLCETDTGVVLHPESVRRLCCDARIARILVKSTGEVLDLGRSQRLFSELQRKVMNYRDRGCCFPGCHRHAKQCQAHHMTEWEAGGNTDIGNGALLCWVHHRLVHELRWRIARCADGGIDWFRPDGTCYGRWHPPGRPEPIYRDRLVA